MMHPAQRIAFYTPTKGLDGTNRSGERRIVETTLDLLRRAGFAPETPTRLVTFDKRGDPDLQRTLTANAEVETTRLIETLRAEPPALWWTYHSYYKAPDLLGPAVSAALGIPYILQQPTLNPKHLNGPWAAFARASKAAHDHADLLLWATRRDLPALHEAAYQDKLWHLPPVIEPGTEPQPRGPGVPVSLLTVAMMHEGDKLESYRRLAAALAKLRFDWRLRVAGDGPARGEVEALFRHLTDRVTFLGALPPEEVRQEYADADVFVWPGVGEGVGMVYLEAQAAGLPVAAEEHEALRDVIGGERCERQDAESLATLIESHAAHRRERGIEARRYLVENHAPAGIAPRLGARLRELLS